MSQVEQLIIVPLKAHLAKRMFCVRQENVSRDQTSQYPSERKVFSVKADLEKREADGSLVYISALR